MNHLLAPLVLCLALAFATPAFSQPSAETENALTPAVTVTNRSPELYAQKKKSLTQSKSFKVNSPKKGSKSMTEVNFDESLIEGSVRTPFGGILSSRDPEVNGGFVRIRRKWHDMLIMSVGSLSP